MSNTDACSQPDVLNAQKYERAPFGTRSFNFFTPVIRLGGLYKNHNENEDFIRRAQSADRKTLIVFI
jgi:hypothetical protein